MWMNVPDKCVFMQVTEEGVAKDAAAIVVSGDIVVPDVDNSIDQVS